MAFKYSHKEGEVEDSVLDEVKTKEESQSAEASQTKKLIVHIDLKDEQKSVVRIAGKIRQVMRHLGGFDPRLNNTEDKSCSLAYEKWQFPIGVSPSMICDCLEQMAREIEPKGFTIKLFFMEVLGDVLERSISCPAELSLS